MIFKTHKKDLKLCYVSKLFFTSLFGQIHTFLIIEFNATNYFNSIANQLSLNLAELPVYTKGTRISLPVLSVNHRNEIQPNKNSTPFLKKALRSINYQNHNFKCKSFDYISENDTVDVLVKLYF